MPNNDQAGLFSEPPPERAKPTRSKSTPAQATSPTKTAADPSLAQEWRRILAPVDVVRDPIHGDIRLSKLERSVIDTPEFQRLRNLYQLGTSYYVYPGATHSRFNHSLGVLHVCSQMIATCNSNAEGYSSLAPSNHPVPLQIPEFCIVLARLCALMHDLAHVPFGHTFDKEARLFKNDEWKDAYRVEKVFGPDSGITRCIQERVTEEGFPSAVADELINEVRSILTATREDLDTLRYPFIHDLVGNTICADLIDYVRRDMHYCGLTERFGDRFLNYLGLFALRRSPLDHDYVPVTAERGEAFPTRSNKNNVETCRVVLMTYRYNERRDAISKADVLGEAIDLVRRRLAVAQKIYYHRTKLVTSAILASAVADSGMKVGDIWDLSDLEVLSKLESSSNKRVSVLAKKLRRRRLFKPIYEISFPSDDDVRHHGQVMEVYDRFSEMMEQKNLAAKLEQLIGLQHKQSSADPVGSVVISNPERKMSVKTFDMLVLRDPLAKKIATLEQSAKGPVKKEISAIKETHAKLWRLQVFVDPDVVKVDKLDPLAQTLAAAIAHEVGLANEVDAFSGLPSIDLNQRLGEDNFRSTVRRLGINPDQLKRMEYAQLLDMGAHRLDEDGYTDTIRHALIERGYQLKS